MIVPMIKYTFLLHHSEQDRFMEQIGDVGVVDVTVGNYEPSKEEITLLANINTLQQMIESLRIYGVGRDVEGVKSFNYDIPKSIERYNTLSIRYTTIKSIIGRLDKAIREVEPWGKFSAGEIDRLRQLGIRYRYLICPVKQYNPEWENQYNIDLINNDGTHCYFIGIDTDDEPFEYPSPAVSDYKTPRMDIVGFTKRKGECFVLRDELMNDLDAFYVDLPLFMSTLEDMKMELHQIQIESGNRKAAEGSLIIVDGWCPENSTSELDNMLDKEDCVVYFKDKPVPHDAPPIKLKNNKFASPMELITRLFSLPNYNEIDMTPFFAPFFIFFVGICLGDVVYGALLFVAALIAWFKVKPTLKPVLTLVLWCSFSAMVMGAVTGVYGGMEVKATMLLTNDDMFYFAIVVGLLQIFYAMTLQAIFRMKRFGFLYGLSQIGWIMTLLTVGAGVGLPMAGIEGFTTSSPLFTILLILGLGLTMFFQNPKKNPFVNIGSGLWFLYNAVTGLLSDTLSYVRLFALGLSGAIIAGVFNTLALELSPDVPVLKWIVMLIILVIGHGINLFMSAISAFVHPLRLTFVEFYKNVGFEGGGRAYEPFVKRKK